MDELPKGPPEDLLSSWKEIASYLDTTVRNAQRWEPEAGLPVRRVLHKKKASVYAYRSEIEAWRVSRDVLPETIEEVGPVHDKRAEARAVGSQRRFRTGLVAGAAIVAIALAVAGYRRGANPEHSPRVAPLTSLEGIEISPKFSPDGTRVVFAWMKAGRDDFDLYLADVDSGGLTALAETEYSEINPAWSRDGTRIAFMRLRGFGRNARRAELVVLTLDGGGEEVLAQPAAYAGPIEWLPESTMTWTADGKGLLMAGGRVRQGIHRYDIETGNLDRLTDAPEGGLGDFAPELSPDGRLLTFVRTTAAFLSDVYVLDLENPTEPARRLTSWGRWTTSPTFTPEGGEILVSSGDVGGERRFWSLDPRGAREPRLLALAGEDSFSLTLAPSGVAGRPRMAFTRGVVKSDIWRVVAGEAASPERVVSSSRLDSNPALSPDGARLAFESNRSGRAELWICDADGANPRQLTADAPPFASQPDWAPDGSRLVTSAIFEGVAQLFSVSPESGELTRLTDGPGDKLNPRWARSGESIHFLLSREDNVGYIGFVPADGGEIGRLFDGSSGVVAVETPSGGFISATQNGMLIRIENGQPARGRTRVGQPSALRATEKGLVFLSPIETPAARGYYLKRDDSARPELLAGVDRPWLGLAVSDDATRLYYSRVEEVSLDLQLVDEVW